LAKTTGTAQLADDFTQPHVDARPFSLHRRHLELSDVHEVDVDRESGQLVGEDVERRAAV